MIWTKRFTRTLIALIVSLVLLAVQTLNSNKSHVVSMPTPDIFGQQTFSESESAKTVRVTRVIDGDTIEIEGGIKIRYIGIDTPESIAPGKPVGCFGEEAYEKNKNLVLGKEIEIEKDVSETDKYNRLLRYVYVDGLFVNNELVKSGYAQVSTYPPDVKFQTLFLESQKYARENNLGLWSECF